MYFPDELWSIVKEYAGIYSVGTKYKISKEKLLEFYETEFNVSIKNKAKCKADVIKKYIMNQIRFKMTRDKWVALHKICNPIVYTFAPPKLEGKIGQEIHWWAFGSMCGGVIVGHYKYSYKVKRYHTLVTDVTTTNTITRTTHTYIKSKLEKPIHNVSKWASTLVKEDEVFKQWTHIFDSRNKHTSCDWE